MSQKDIFVTIVLNLYFVWLFKEAINQRPILFLLGFLKGNLNFLKDPMSRHLFRGLELLVPLALFEFIVKQTIITACLPPRVVPSASAPLDSGIVPYFQPSTASHVSSFHRRSSSFATLTASWEIRIWVRDVPWMESCPLSSCSAAMDRAPPPHPIDILPTP